MIIIILFFLKKNNYDWYNNDYHYCYFFIYLFIYIYMFVYKLKFHSSTTHSLGSEESEPPAKTLRPGAGGKHLAGAAGRNAALRAATASRYQQQLPYPRCREYMLTLGVYWW